MDFQFVLFLSMSMLVLGSAALPAAAEFPKENKGLEDQSVDEASTVFSYKRAVTDGDEVYEEEYKIDLGRQTEEIRVPAHGRSDAAVVLMDFKENVTMYKFPDKRICFFGRLDGREMSPRALVAELEKGIQYERAERLRTTVKWHAVSLVDPSTLSDEVALLCAKFPIHRIEKNRGQFPAVVRGRVKRADWNFKMTINLGFVKFEIEIGSKKDHEKENWMD